MARTTVPTRDCRVQQRQRQQQQEDEEEDEEEEEEDDCGNVRRAYGFDYEEQEHEGDDEGENDSDAGEQPPAAAHQHQRHPSGACQQRRIRRIRSRQTAGQARGRSASYGRGYRARADITSPAATGSVSPPETGGTRSEDDAEEDEDVGVEYAVLLPDSFAVLDPPDPY
uniref:Uncharacterized protein n=1 Tax=Anopheles dirus TaxID=7168 RepID=A0A182MZI9_9DIPT